MTEMRIETMTSEDALKLFASADVVSFDVFDTLLMRPVLRPVDVFTLVRHRVAELGVFLPVSWASARHQAETRAYQKAGVGPYITIDDIYDELVERFSMSTNAAQQAKAAEIEVELAVLRATSRGRRLFAAAQEAGCVIVILSDMYLPPGVIAEALNNAGYSGWERLFVSGYEKFAKHDATAFRALRSIYPDDEIMHIGDNPHADRRQPTTYEMTGVELVRPLQMAVSRGQDAYAFSSLEDVGNSERLDDDIIGASIVGGVIERHIEAHPDESSAAQIGYSVLGPILTGFAQYLQWRAVKDGCDQLVFLARDGNILRQGYQRYWGEQAVRSTYLPASRRLFQFPSFQTSLVDIDMNFLTASSAPLTPDRYVSRFMPDLSSEKMKRALAVAGVRADRLMYAAEARQKLVPAFEHLSADIVAAAKLEREALLKMLQEELNGDSYALVDIGWQGSIQRSLERLIGCTVNGYYIGITDFDTTAGRPQLHGWLDMRDGGEAADRMRRIFDVVTVPEILTSSPTEPSAMRVELDENRHPRVVYGNEQFGPDEAETLSAIQAAAVEFVGDFAEAAKLLPATSSVLSFQTAVDPLIRLIEDPTPGQAEVLGKFEHDDSIGADVTTNIGCPRHSARYYFWHRDVLQREYDACWWKKGFLINAERMNISTRSLRR